VLLHDGHLLQLPGISLSRLSADRTCCQATRLLIIFHIRWLVM